MPVPSACVYRLIWTINSSVITVKKANTYFKIRRIRKYRESGKNTAVCTLKSNRFCLGTARSEVQSEVSFGTVQGTIIKMKGSLKIRFSYTALL